VQEGVFRDLVLLDEPTATSSFMAKLAEN